MNRQRDALRLRIELLGISPPIWREILVPARYSFWDLHVAVQDAMGWWDSHLHAFRPRGSSMPGGIEIGIPTDDDYTEVTPGWEVPVVEYLSKTGDRIIYEYDFGDGWEHDIVLLAIEPRVKGQKYPQCLAGERACPPEDCGGVRGYERLVAALFDPEDDEHEELMEWIPEGWRPEQFDRTGVRFNNPTRRWRQVFEENY